MANSLLDLGSLTTQAIQLGQLAQTQERNRISQLNVEQDTIRNKEYALQNRMNLAMKIVDDKLVPVKAKEGIYREIAAMAGFQSLTGDQVANASDILSQMGTAASKGDSEGLELATKDLMQLYPSQALETFTAQSKLQELNDKAVMFQQHLEENKEKLNVLQEKRAALKLSNEAYVPALSQIRSVLTPLKGNESILYDKNPITRKEGLRTHPELAALEANAPTAFRASVQELAQAQQQLTYWKEQKELVKRGESPMAMEAVDEHIVAYKRLIQAKDAEATFYSSIKPGNTGQPGYLDREAYKRLVEAENELSIGARESLKGIKQVDDTRRGFLDVANRRFKLSQDKELRAALDHKTTGYAFEMMMGYINQGYTDNKAITQALKDAKETFPDGVVDTAKLRNPEKVGKMEMNFGSPGERDKIATDRTMIREVNDLIADFNPDYVGWTDAKMGRLGQMAGVLSEERENWIQRSRSLAMEIRHGYYGAALTETEKDMAVQEMPNEDMGDNQWLAAARAWKKKWGRLIDERMRLIQMGHPIPGGKTQQPPDPATIKKNLMQRYQDAPKAP